MGQVVRMAGIKDVATRAGVSISTVSYVMNGTRPIGKETREKVIQAASDLGYSPRTRREPSVTRHTRILAVSSPVHAYTNYSNYSKFFFGLAKRAKRYDHDLLLLMDESSNEEIRRIAQEGIVDGIFLLDVLIDDSRAEAAKSIGIPVVSIGYPENCGGIYSVDLDFSRMARDVANRANDLGYRRILFVGSSQNAYRNGSNFIVRFRSALERRADELGMTVIWRDFRGNVSRQWDESEALVTSTFINNASKVDAIICQADTPQIASLEGALARYDLNEIPIIATCSGGGITQLQRPLDEIPMDPSRVCARAVDLMMEILDGKRADYGHVELLPYEYRDRGTFGVPSHAAGHH